MPSGQPAGSELGEGSVIAGYRIEARIGRGGMATVFRAHDERLGRTVALKVLAPALTTDLHFRARFVRESRAAAATDHPHIIPVFEAGEARGVLFIAMRFVRGGDLRWQLSQFGPLASRAVADIVSQAASALDAAHKRGVVHRDVKPANLLLDVGQDRGEPDHLYLSDFGLSKDSLAANTVTVLTAAGQILGSLDYVAPEQIECSAIDGRADQYSLACTAYELLCGTPPFGQRASMALLHAHRSGTPPPITSRQPGLPVRADAVFARALAKDRQYRYRSCGDFAGALRKAFGLEPYDSGRHITAAPNQQNPQGPFPPGPAQKQPMAQPPARADPARNQPAPQRPPASPSPLMPRAEAAQPPAPPTIIRGRIPAAGKREDPKAGSRPA